MDKVQILGVGVDNLSLQEVLEKAKTFIDSKDQHFIVTPNPEFLVAADGDEKFHQILNYADIAIADGIGLSFAAKWQGDSLQRVTGVDLVWSITELAQQNNWSIFLLGGEEGVAIETAQIMDQEFPGIKIAGATSGGEINHLTDGGDELIRAINATRPQILFVALGQIKQEKWIFANLDKLSSVKIAIGVGGTFDYISGNTPRAPKPIRHLGLEWVYRLINEPSRWKRIFNAVIIFPFLIIKNNLTKK